MGKEATIRARLAGETRTCTVWLESRELIIGAPARSRTGRRVIPFADMSSLAAHTGTLSFRAGGHAIELALGDQARSWLDAIRNPRTRVQKLGITPDARLCAIGAVEEGVEDELAAAAAGKVSRRIIKDADIVLLFATTVADLARLKEIEPALAPGGAVWVLWPKGRRDFTHQHVVAGARAARLSQTRSMGFSPANTGLRLVRPAGKPPKEHSTTSGAAPRKPARAKAAIPQPHRPIKA